MTRPWSEVRSYPPPAWMTARYQVFAAEGKWVWQHDALADAQETAHEAGDESFILEIEEQQ